MKYYLRKTKKFKTEEEVTAQFEKDESKLSDEFKVFVDVNDFSYMSEQEILDKDKDKQIKDEEFDKTQIHVCKHEEGLPCELVNL